ncbi:atherin [Triticum aestivum]|uniref:atherin n=1 Tax=Triticum aestivum TaxID=4565 RepID=UPI001D011467|nr:atherin-like [Triticum aestivum]
MASSSSSSSSSSMPSTAASSSQPPADAALAPSLDYDTAFPVLGSLPPRPPRGGRAAPPPRPPRRSEDRRRGGKTPSYTLDRDTVGMSPGSLYGRAGDAAAETTAATAEAAPAMTSSAPATSTSAGTISARPPTCAAPGTFAAAKAVLSGLPALLPAVQVFGDYRFGYTMGDLFQDLEKLQLGSPNVNEPMHPPPLQFQVQPPLRSQRLQPPLLQRADGSGSAPGASAPVRAATLRRAAASGPSSPATRHGSSTATRWRRALRCSYGFSSSISRDLSRVSSGYRAVY